MLKGTCTFKSSPKSVLMGTQIEEDLVSLSLFVILISLVIGSKVVSLVYYEGLIKPEVVACHCCTVQFFWPVFHGGLSLETVRLPVQSMM